MEHDLFSGSSDDDSDSSLHSEARNERRRQRLADIMRRRNESIEQAAENRRAIVRVHDANRRFLDRVAAAANNKLSHRSKLDSFTDVQLGAVNSNVFAHQSAGDGKSFLHGQYRNMFSFCQQINRFSNKDLCADEMVPYDKPGRLFFDLEVKQIDSCSAAEVEANFIAERAKVDEYERILKGHVEGSLLLGRVSGHTAYNPSSTLVRQLAEAYRREAGEPFTEEICATGVRVVLTEIKLSIQRIMGSDVESGDTPWNDLYVTSGCRPGKFSLHVVMGRIFFDRSYLSCPIVVYEIARFFVMSNVIWLLWSNDISLWETPEGRFRLRCLMIDDLMANPCRFKGMRDSVFDEGVYAKRHLLRLPGTAKPDGCHPLHPVQIPNDLANFETTGFLGSPPILMKPESCFAQWFPDNDAGLQDWLLHTVNGASREEHAYEPTPTYMFAGWEPSEYFIGEVAWRHSRDVENGKDTRFSTTEAINQNYTPVFPLNKHRYVEYRRCVKLPLTEEERQLYGKDVDWSAMSASFKPTEEFRVRESQMMVPFDNIPPDTMIHHTHHGSEREETRASAKTWLRGQTRGYYCHKCGINYIAEEPTPEYIESRFVFAEDQIRHADLDMTRDPPEPYPYIANPGNDNAIKPDFFLSKKWSIIDAVMGSGKTEELMRFVDYLRLPNYNRKRILVITFRISLAQQIAKRFKMKCYKCSSDDREQQKLLDKQISDDVFDELVICVNSLRKVGKKKWDIVILDECGLIRLHLLSIITAPQLKDIFPKLMQCMRGAAHVVLCQEFVSECDVEFYMGQDDTDCYDATKVNALRFIKPVKIHPIKHTTNFYLGIHQMIECYMNSFDVDGACVSPFMVFVTKVSLAEFIVHILVSAAEEKFKGDPVMIAEKSSRIKGLWRAMRTKSDFARNFLLDPNNNAERADVVVTTSIIGAGFSIDTHFLSFHAFMSVDVLDHWMQRQLIQRLRAVLREVNGRRPRPCQSYLYTEKGRASDRATNAVSKIDLAKEFNKIRAEITKRAVLNNDPLAQCAAKLRLLEDTQATVVAREMVTRDRNDDLWREYSRVDLDSDFKKHDEELTDEHSAFIKKEILNFVKKHRRDIAEQLEMRLIEAGLEGGDDNVMDDDEGLCLIESLNESNMREVMVNAATDANFLTWKRAVNGSGVAAELLRMKYGGLPSSEESKKHRELNNPEKTLTRLQHLACWITFHFQGLGCAEEGTMLFDTYYSNRFQTKTCRAASGMMLASKLIPGILSGTCAHGVTCEALVRRGSTSMYLEARLAKFHDAWADTWRSCFCNEDTDDSDSREWKESNKKLFDLLCIDNVSGTRAEKLQKCTTKYSTIAQQDKEGREGTITKDAKYPTFHLLVKLCGHLGLELGSTRNDRPQCKSMCSDGKSRDTFRVKLDPHNFGVMLLMKKNFIERVRTMIPELLHSDNLTESAKEFVSDAVNKHNGAVEHMVHDTDPIANKGVDEQWEHITRARADRLTLSTVLPPDHFVVVTEQRQRENEKDRREAEAEVAAAAARSAAAENICEASSSAGRTFREMPVTSHGISDGEGETQWNDDEEEIDDRLHDEEGDSEGTLESGEEAWHAPPAQVLQANTPRSVETNHTGLTRRMRGSGKRKRSEGRR